MLIIPNVTVVDGVDAARVQYTGWREWDVGDTDGQRYIDLGYAYLSPNGPAYTPPSEGSGIPPLDDLIDTVDNLL